MNNIDKPVFPIKELQKIVNDEIARRTADLNKCDPAELYDPVVYSLGVGGKRLRPVLLLMACNLFSDEVQPALPAAVAVEVFHNFTLLHDDIMDKAEIRRNQPTVHLKFGENSAILSGDAMSFLSYKYLTKCRTDKLNEVMDLFTKTALEVCEGQQFDMDFESRNDVTEAEYLQMIKLKTAVLMGCSLKMGALVGNAPENAADLLYEFGINLGLAFQLQDDWLDTFGKRESFGKKIGGDILSNKKTYLLIKALEKANAAEKTVLNTWLKATDFDPDQKIGSVTEIYRQLGIKEFSEGKIDFYYQRAETILKNLPVDDKRKIEFKALSRNMLDRNI